MTGLVARKKSKFSGREREKERLRSILNEVADGRGRVVLVEGEAGIGKTRFVEEVSKLPEASQFFQLSTRCVYFEEIDPYLPFKELYFRYREIVKETGGWAEGTETYPEKLEAEEAAEPVPLSLLPLMLEEEGAESGGQEEPTPERRVEFVFDLERRGPVFIFIDDVHWIDRASLNLIKYLSNRINSRRILLIAAYRPEDLYLDREKTKTLMETLKSLGRERITEKIVLGHLDKRSVEDILKDQLEVNKLPEGLLDEIYKNSGGNPFFVEEILFSLISQGILFPGAVDNDVVGKIKKAEIPSTLSDLIARRYDSLSDDAKRLVRTAAVIGLEAGVELLQRVVELDGERLLDALEELQMTHFLEEGEGEEGVYYRFKNSIIQEFIYQNLSLSRRRYLHNKIAAVMEEFYRNRPTHYNAIAIHYFNGENFSMAARYYTLAANAILKKNPADAVDYLEKALTIYREMKEERPEEYLRTLMNIITILIEMGDIRGVEGYLTEMETFLGKRRIEFREYWLKTRHRLGELLILKGDLNGAKRVLGGLLKEKSIFKYPEEASRFYRNMGYVFWKLGNLEDSLKMYSSSLKRAKNDRQVNYVMKLYLDIGNLFSYKGEMGKAREYYLNGLRIIETQGNIYDEIRVHNNIADSYLREGRYEEAFEESKKAVELSKRYGFKMAWPYLTHLEVLARLGDEKEFLKHLKEMESYLPDFDVERSPDVKFGKALLLLTTAEKHKGGRKKNLLKKAEELLEEVCRGFEERGFFYEKAQALTTLGELLIMEGNVERAREALLEAKKYFQGYSNRYMMQKIEEMLESISH